VKYLQSHDPQEIAGTLEEKGYLDIEGSKVTMDHVSTTKETGRS
jgi:valyl-tRNA synthetase